MTQYEANDRDELSLDVSDRVDVYKKVEGKNQKPFDSSVTHKIRIGLAIRVFLQWSVGY